MQCLLETEFDSQAEGIPSLVTERRPTHDHARPSIS